MLGRLFRRSTDNTATFSMPLADFERLIRAQTYVEDHAPRHFTRYLSQIAGKAVMHWETEERKSLYADPKQYEITGDLDDKQRQKLHFVPDAEELRGHVTRTSASLHYMRYILGFSHTPNILFVIRPAIETEQADKLSPFLLALNGKVQRPKGADEDHIVFDAAWMPIFDEKGHISNYFAPRLDLGEGPAVIDYARHCVEQIIRGQKLTAAANMQASAPASSPSLEM